MDIKFNLDSIDKTFTKFIVGSKVEATVVDYLKDGVLINIGGKKDGFIEYNEEEDLALKNIKKGDKFQAIVLNTKDESGFIILSKAKADFLNNGNKIVKNLKVGDKTSIIITSCNNLGLNSNIGEYEVFIPFSQISNKKVDNNLKNYVNKNYNVIILEINHENKNIIASIKSFEENEKICVENAFWQSIFENKIVYGKVVRITDFGAFVNVSGVDCLVHNSEIDFDKNKSASDVLEIDKSYNFRVINVDRQNKKVSLSYKALQENPLKKKLEQLNIGDIINGEVIKILPFGAIIRFGDNIEGLLHVKEASQLYVKNIYEVAKVGQKLDLKIIDIDIENLKVSLSLKAMQEDPKIAKISKFVEKD